MSKRLFYTEYDPIKNFLKLKLMGEIDHHLATEIREQADKIIIENRPKALIMELSDVDFMDSSGLGLIMGRYKLIKELGGTTIVRNPSDRTRKIHMMAGMDRIIKIENRKENKNEESFEQD